MALKHLSLHQIIAAMRKGMAISYPSHGTFFRAKKKHGKTCGTCAVGAMVIGLGRKLEPVSGQLITPFVDKFGSVDVSPISFINAVTNYRLIDCPEIRICSHTTAMYVGTLADHLFEHHRWTRVHIARYLERQLNAATSHVGV